MNPQSLRNLPTAPEQGMEPDLNPDIPGLKAHSLSPTLFCLHTHVKAFVSVHMLILLLGSLLPLTHPVNLQLSFKPYLLCVAFPDLPRPFNH